MIMIKKIIYNSAIVVKLAKVRVKTPKFEDQDGEIGLRKICKFCEN